MFKTGLILILLATLYGCAASTPLLLAGGGGHKMMNHQESIKIKAAAALDEEGDLLTYSLKGIAENRTEDVVETFIKGYTDSKYSSAMKSLAIYQIGLVYMNRYNEQRDDQKALQYFKRHQIEFPNSVLEKRIAERIALINARTKQTVQLSPQQLLAQVNTKVLLNQPKVPYDDELTPMSERAISQDRIEDAHGVYTVVYENPGSSDNIKAKAMYQLGLIYMSPYNTKSDESKAIGFFSKILREFPNTPTAKRAEYRISQLHNQPAYQ